jgi:hypothetical protein
MQLSQQKSKGRSSTSNRVIFRAVTIVKYLSNASYWNHNLEKFDGVVLEIGRRKLYIKKERAKDSKEAISASTKIFTVRYTPKSERDLPSSFRPRELEAEISISKKYLVGQKVKKSREGDLTYRRYCKIEGDPA